MAPNSDQPSSDSPSMSPEMTYRTVLPGVDGLPIDSDNFDDLLTACLDRLARVGPLPEPSQLRGLLPEGDPVARSFILIELVKMDMALSAQSGTLRRVEVYCDALCELLPIESIPFDLLLEEFQLRKEMGDPPSVDEVAKRFPRFVSVLGQLSSRCEATVADRELRPLPDLSQHGRLDDFLLLQELGRGAFATVYLAKQLSMQRLVALKISRGKGQESQALAQFDHANIVRVFDQRLLQDQQLHLLYMQFHPGGTLADVVSLVRQEGVVDNGALLLESVDRKLLQTAQSVPDGSSIRQMIAQSGWPTVVAWVGIQLANALTEAHSHGVLHRDVKPANVLLSAEGVPKLADFNVSFAGAAGRAGAAANFGGSIGYMSPEHLLAIKDANPHDQASVNESSDLYSLAVLLWELWQGERPFDVPSRTSSWSDAIASQLKSREQDFHLPRRTGDAAERVLEKVLRLTLSANPQVRPVSGAEMAGRLKLALYPEAAELFDVMAVPQRSWVMQRSPWLVATAIILTPHLLGGALNFQYNYNEVVSQHMQEGLVVVSWFVNLILFPLGAVLIAYFASSVMYAIQAAKAGKLASDQDIDDTLVLGNRAAMVGGTLWLIAGGVFPIALSMMYSDFTFIQTVHFMLSSIICGAIAMIYPFYGMALLSTLVYYPFFLAGSMIDEAFQRRASRIIKQSEIYLLVAALIPFLALALLILSETTAQIFMFVAVGAGSIGLLASFFAHRILQKTWNRMGEVLQ